MYDPMLVEPMRRELTSNGVKELRSAEEVDKVMQLPGTTLVVVNSVCGCAAGCARPGVVQSLKHEVLPDNIVTVFAGQDKEATARAREYFTDQPPSSPSIGLLQDGKLIGMIHRHQIEGRTPEMIAEALTNAYDQYCGQNVQ